MVKEELGSATALMGDIGRFLILYGSLFSPLEMRGPGKVNSSGKNLLPPLLYQECAGEEENRSHIVNQPQMLASELNTGE